jgi:hypothetical protein
MDNLMNLMDDLPDGEDDATGCGQQQSFFYFPSK